MSKNDCDLKPENVPTSIYLNTPFRLVYREHLQGIERIIKAKMA